MADTPFSHIYFNGDDKPIFTKVNEAINPEKLPPEELVSLENMRLDEEIGMPTTRKGFTRYHNYADTTGKINSIYDVIDKNGDNYLLAQIGTKLRKSLDGSAAYSDVKTGLTNAKLRMAVYGEKFYFTNNNEQPFYSDLTNTYNMEVVRPDITNVLITDNIASGANILDYLYVMAFVTADGEVSNISNRMGIDGQSGVTTPNFTLSSLPVSSDPRVVSKKIYRTNKNDFSNFYLLDTIDNAVTSYTDIIDDSALNTTESPVISNIPKKAKYITTNGERIIFGNIIKLATNRIIAPATFPGTFVADDTQSGNLSAGTYKWARSLVDVNGNESELVFLTTDTLVAGKKVSLYIPDDALISFTDITDPTTWLINTSIKSARYYRTKANGSTYYYLTDILNNDLRTTYFSTPYVDNTADSSLTVAYPKSANSYTEQLILKSSVVFSNLYKPLEFPELNLIEIYPDEGDEITGIFDDDNGIIIFKQKSICKLYTGGASENWEVKKLVENIGCDEPDSIFKRGNSYYFMYQKRPHYFDGQSQPQNIGETRKITFDSVTEVNGTTFWDKGLWYILSVKVGTTYYLLCYDTKLGGWYRFSISKSDVITRKEFGSDAGLILAGGNIFIIYYNESASSDTDSGSTVSIGVSLKTKDFVVDDFINMRLRFLFLNYLGIGSPVTKSLTFSLTDPSTNKIIYYNDVSSVITNNNFYCSIDGMVDSTGTKRTLLRSRKINFSFTGYGLKKFFNGRLDYIIEPWGVQRRTPVVVEGFGMQQGTKAGVND